MPTTNRLSFTTLLPASDHLDNGNHLSLSHIVQVRTYTGNNSDTRHIHTIYMSTPTTDDTTYSVIYCTVDCIDD